MAGFTSILRSTLDSGLIITILSLIWLVICAVMDWKNGVISNWLTMPGMFIGILNASFHSKQRVVFTAVVFAGCLILYLLRGLGGADVKVLTGLAGLWPAAVLGALVMQGIWGVVVLVRSGKNTKFCAIPSYALGAAASLILLL